MYTFDRRTADAAGAFLIGELERLDPTINMPLNEVTWQRDIDLREDVTIVDETASFIVAQIAAAGMAGSGKNWIGKNSTAIPGVSLGLDKLPLPLHLWGMELAWTIIELQAAQQLGRPLDTSKYDAMRVKYQLDIDEQVYVGDTAVGATGLINAPGIAPVNLVENWLTASAANILGDFNAYLTHAWTRAGYTVAPTHVLLPPGAFAALLRPVSEAGSESILSYVKKNCVAAIKNGKPIEIQPLKWLTGAGAGGLDRVIAYTRDKRYVRYPLVPMQKTPVELRGLQQLTVYYSKLGHVEMVYPETITYGDMPAPVEE